MKQYICCRLTFIPISTTNRQKYSLANEKQYFKLFEIAPKSHPYQSQLEENSAFDMWIKTFLIAGYCLKVEELFQTSDKFHRETTYLL